MSSALVTTAAQRERRVAAAQKRVDALRAQMARLDERKADVLGKLAYAEAVVRHAKATPVPEEVEAALTVTEAIAVMLDVVPPAGPDTSTPVQSELEASMAAHPASGPVRLGADGQVEAVQPLLPDDEDDDGVFAGIIGEFRPTRLRTVPDVG